MDRLSRRAAISYLAILFIICLFRAWTQAITTDEAYSYWLFVAPDQVTLFNRFNATHHVLQTILMFVSARVFGTSEFTLRLPSLLGCGLYFTAVYRIARKLFDSSPMLLLAVVLLTINPLILDNMSVARGYGLALGLFGWAFSYALESELTKGAAFLALSVTANFTFLFPAVALISVLGMQLLLEGRFWSLIRKLVGPVVVIAFVILVLPMSRAQRGDFYFGASSAREMIHTLLSASLTYRSCGMDGYPGCYQPTFDTIGFAVVILFTFSCGVAAIFLVRRWKFGSALLATGTFVLTAAFVFVSHAVFGMHYPWARTGLYFLFLAPLCLLVLPRLWPAALILALAMAAQFDARYYTEWRFDASNQDVVDLLTGIHENKGSPVKLAASFPMHFEFEFYRDVRKLNWLDVSDLRSSNGGFDYYVLRNGDRQLLHDLGLREIYHSDLSGISLAAAPSQVPTVLPVLERFSWNGFKQVIYILFAAGLMFATSLLTGNVLLRLLQLKLEREEAVFIGFVVGSALVAATVYVLAAAGLARKSVLIGAAVTLIVGSFWRKGYRFPAEKLPSIPVGWAMSLGLVWLIFGGLYLSVALAPDVATPIRHSGNSASAMLFLFGTSIGGRSAAAVIELIFLSMCSFGILTYSRRIGSPTAGVIAAILFFASPIAGFTGSTASPEAMIACLAFAVFYLVHRRIWLLAIPLFAFGTWLMIPWMLREFDKPLLHLNGWYSRVPLDLAVYGARLRGMIGPVFLLAPIGIFAIFFTRVRALFPIALLLSAPALAGLEARALMPALPFYSLALAVVLVSWRAVAPVVLAAHVIFSWPAFVDLYADPDAVRLKRSTWAAALRIEPEYLYLMRNLPGYRLGSLLDGMVPDKEKILATVPFETAYHTREIIGPETPLGRRLAQSMRNGSFGPLTVDNIHWLIMPDQDVPPSGVTTKAAIDGFVLYKID